MCIYDLPGSNNKPKRKEIDVNLNRKFDQYCIVNLRARLLFYLSHTSKRRPSKHLLARIMSKFIMNALWI